MTKLLITGASGFVGSFLVEEALTRGIEVHAGIRASSSRQYLSDPRIKFFILDFSTPETYASNLMQEGFTHIIHNAGLTKAQSIEELYKVNSEYSSVFASIAKEKLKNSLKKFVYISSLAAFGPADLQQFQKLTNQSIPKPITSYGKSKLKGELQIKLIENFPWGIIRPTAVFGPREKDLLTVFKTINMGIAPTIGFPKQKLSFIYVKDLARLVLDACLSKRIHFEAFASDTHLYSGQTLNKLIADALGKRSIHLTIPVTMLKLMAYLNELTGKITGAYPALNLEKVKELSSLSWACDTNTIQKDFNFAPAFTLAEAIEETVAWYKANDWL